MPEIVVAAQSRPAAGKNVNRRLRGQGLIPGVLYGAGKQAVPVAVSPKEIGAILRSASGENTLFDLEVGGSRRKVILKEFQVEPIRGHLLHADFYEVALDKPIEVKVHLELKGVPVGVKVQGGVLDFVTRELELTCLPTQIPDKIEVDVSEIELGKHLRVSELKLPDTVKLITELDVVIAHVVAPRAEVAPVAEAAPVAEGAVAAEPEVIKKGKGEGEAEAEPAAEKGKDKDRGKEKKEKK